MHHNKREIARIIEVWAGIFILLSTLALVFAYLLNFEFASPDQSLETDFLYMTNNVALQKTSSIAWMATAIILILFLPLYLLAFYRDHSLIHVLNALIITFISLVLFRASLAGFSAVRLIEDLRETESYITDNQILTYVRDIMLLKNAGISALGVFAFFWSISRFRKAKINILGRILLLLSGPVLAVFTWLNPEHILFNASLAVVVTGMLIYGASLVNKGMAKGSDGSDGSDGN